MRTIILTLAIAAISGLLTSISLAGELMYGCMPRPACGKVCKLVCETKKLTAVGYGYKCDAICIAAPSRPGCKQCYTTCCPNDELNGCPPKIEFCWYDWFACGCAKPRTVKTLTKFQAEHKTNSYHWEVVDAACCDCVTQGGASPTPENPCVYKPAPADAAIGEVLAVSKDELAELESVFASTSGANPTQIAEQPVPLPSPSAEEPERISVSQQIQGLFRR